MIVKNARQRLVDLAIGRIGSQETALWLEVDRQVLDGWASGQKTMPDNKLLALLDLLDRAYLH
jgi:hypothetical protein